MIERIRLFLKKNRTHRGQIIIFVAVVAVSMLGMIGMAVDLGYTFAEKRTVQNAADAAAAAGTRVVTQWSTTNNLITAQSDVANIVKANNMGNATQTFSCFYVDDTGKKLDACGKTVPETATGVSVSVSETHNTFFMRIFPGAPKTVTTSATATAHAEIVTPDGSDGPFIVCGSSAKLVGSNSTMAIINPNGDGTYRLNSDAIGKTFEVHGKIDDCGAQANDYKGVAAEDNYGNSIPGWFTGTNGERTGPVRERVQGVQGCNSSDAYPVNCIMYLPLSYNDGNHPPQSHGNDISLYTVAYGVFRVSECSQPCKHQATLIGKYIIDAPSGMGDWEPDTWKRGDNGIIAIRLTQ
ncbi:MAG TPA: pilus assembly protein TadG-related protein [Nitrolancea sp.]